LLKILNASPGFGAPLSEQELKDFLTTKVLNMHLGTVDENGHAIIHPVGYYYDHSSYRFYILTGKESKKTNNIRKNQIVYYCVDDPDPPYKGVRGKGTAKILENVNFNTGIYEKIMVRYWGSLEHPMALAHRDELKTGEAIILEITPGYFSTWDYSKQ
jgi:general stress protein 26